MHDRCTLAWPQDMVSPTAVANSGLRPTTRGKSKVSFLLVLLVAINRTV